MNFYSKKLPYLTSEIFGWRVISFIKYRFTNLILILFFVACSSENKQEVATEFRKIPAKPSLIKKTKIDYDKHIHVNKLIVDGGFLYIIQPFRSKIDKISLENGAVIKELPIRKKSGKFLTGGRAIDMLRDHDRHYVLETGTPKIQEFNDRWELVKTHHLNLSFFIHDAPGVFELIDGKFYISTIDDFLGRNTYRKKLLKDKDPLFIAYNPKTMEMEKIISAETYLKGVKTDSLPYFNITSTEEYFYFNSRYNATLHKFSRSGKYISSNSSYSNYIMFDEAQVKNYPNQEMGIFDFFIDSERLTYFIERPPTTKNRLWKFEVVCFNFKEKTYWVFELDKNNELISFEGDQLHYLEQTDEGNSIVTLKFE